MPAVSFSTIVQPDPDGVLLIEVPARVIAALGDRKRIPVSVTLNGVGYRSTVALYGGKFYIPARREIREAAKLAAGMRKEHVAAVTEAKRPETRVARIEKVVRALRSQ